MKNYQVIIEEVSSRTISVPAYSEEEAYSRAQSEWALAEHPFTEDDFQKVNFYVKDES